MSSASRHIETTKETEAAVEAGKRAAARDHLEPPPAPLPAVATGVETMRRASARRARPV